MAGKRITGKPGASAGRKINQAKTARRSTKSKAGGSGAKQKKDTSKEPIGEPKATIAATDTQYEEIIKLLWNGTGIIRSNKTVAIALQTEANTGLRIGDVMDLRLKDIIRDGQRYRFHMREGKTKKLRTFTVPDPIYHMLEKHAKVNGIASDEKLFKIGVRDCQKVLQKVVDYLGYEHIATHSFRKYMATRAYEVSGYDIELVRNLLNHSSSAITRRYIGVNDAKTERVIKKITKIVCQY